MKKIFRNLLVLIFLILALSIFTSAQPPTQKLLVQDETWVMASGKTQFRIISANDSVNRLVIKELSRLFTRTTAAKKEDRHGQYWEHSFYFRNEYWNTIVAFIKRL